MLTYSSPDEHGCDEELPTISEMGASVSYCPFGRRTVPVQFSRSPQEATSLSVPPGSSPELDDDDDEEVIISKQRNLGGW